MSKNIRYYPTFVYLIGVLAFSQGFLVCFSGCGVGTWDALKESESVDKLRRFVQHNPKDPNVADARKRISLLEYRDAVNSDSRYGYMLFLERHPDSVYALEVKRRLEDFDYRKALEENTIESLQDYLEAWPHGRNVPGARKKLESKICRRWLQCPKPGDLLRFLTAHTDLPCLDELNARVEQLRFEHASKSSGSRELAEFIEIYPKGNLSSAARKILLERHVRALIEAARFERAMQVIQRDSQPGEHTLLERNVAESRDRWIAATFDPIRIRAYLKKTRRNESKQLESWALELEKGQKEYAGLARDVSFLTSRPLPGEPKETNSLDGDPRNRVLWMRSLASYPDESSLDTLLDGLMDSFESVRLSALVSLAILADSLGDIRTEAWAMDRKKRLETTASTGSILTKLAVLHVLAGDSKRALELLENDLTASSAPDPFMLYLAMEIGMELGKEKWSAIMASRLSTEIHRRCRQRIEAWTGDKVSEGEQGWISLRRVHGLLLMWERVMVLFPPEASGDQEPSEFDSIAGPWREESWKNLSETRTWFGREERRWSAKVPEYLPCETAGQSQSESRSIAREQEAVFRLAISASARVEPVLRWCACCHPRLTTRAFATLIGYQIGLVRRLASLWQVADLDG